MGNVKGDLRQECGNSKMKRKKGVKFIRVLLLAVIAVCLIQIGRTYYLSMEHRKQQDELKEIKAAYETGSIDEAGSINEIESIQELAAEKTKKIMWWRANYPDSLLEGEPERPVMLDMYAALYAENQDLAGWLSIEDMVIDYPVMQCEDDEYYLHHDYYGEESNYGCLYVRNAADVNTPGTNFIIYGHNMKDGTMFGDLDLYREESFYKEHSTISFDTLYEERTYEIIAVFRSRIYNSDDEVFKYYQFYQADTQEEFDYFYNNIKEMSLYDTGVTAEFGDTFLTLSTCAYHVQDGRFVVVAKRLQ